MDSTLPQPAKNRHCSFPPSATTGQGQRGVFHFFLHHPAAVPSGACPRCCRFLLGRQTFFGDLIYGVLLEVSVCRFCCHLPDLFLAAAKASGKRVSVLVFLTVKKCLSRPLTPPLAARVNPGVKPLAGVKFCAYLRPVRACGCLWRSVFGPKEVSGCQTEYSWERTERNHCPIFPL